MSKSRVVTENTELVNNLQEKISNLEQNAVSYCVVLQRQRINNII